MMGLLDTQMPQGQPQGLLGQPMPQQQPQGQSDGLKMAMMLSQNPTPETVSSVIEMAHKSGNPNAEQFVQMLEKLGSPESIKHFADQVIQKLQGA